MAHFNVLWDGAEVPPSGSPAPAPNTYEISAIPAPVPDPDFPLSMQWQADGVDLGEPNVRVINFIAALDEFLVTRGTGEQSNVITVRKLTVPPPDDVLLLVHFDGDYTDFSQYAVVPTVVGATISSDSQYGSGAGTTGGGVGRRVTYIGEHLNLNLYADWTIEINRKRLGSVSPPFVIGMNHADPSNTYSWFISDAIVGSEPYTIRWNAFDGALAQATLNQNTLTTPGYVNGDRYSIAITKQGSTYRMFLDGVLQSSTTWAGSMYESPEPPAVQLFYQTIAAPVISSNDLLDELRISSSCRYTANYTPTGPFPNP